MTPIPSPHTRTMMNDDTAESRLPHRPPAKLGLRSLV